ncbi:flagellar assembly protein FliW [Nesterenkonia rhizosphaerae]|uniref:Flagellar assembly protein FliW n=1 Tax=Nesterenkonia rhizosphaerae TaxID=1348272 RepID=A0ABP9FW88_9MICC
MTELSFPDSLPGLAPLRTFRLSDVQGAVGLYSLDSAEMPEVRLFLLDPGVHLPDYSPRLERHLKDLGAGATEELRTLLVVNSSDGAIHVNLLAPVLINTVTSSGAQVILEGQDYPVRQELALPTA